MVHGCEVTDLRPALAGAQRRIRDRQDQLMAEKGSTVPRRSLRSSAAVAPRGATGSQRGARKAKMRLWFSRGREYRCSSGGWGCVP